MTEAPTTRNPEMDGPTPLPAVVQAVPFIGHRHRCTLCHEAGRANEPLYLCHHCGRPFCAECAPRLWGPLRFFFEHQDMKWWRGRGQHVSWLDRRFGHAALEAAHCPYHVHYTPRTLAWIALGMVVILLGVGLALTEAGTTWIIALPLLAVLVPGGALYYFAWDSYQKSELFFPLDAAPPVLELREKFEADAVLDSDGYSERFREGMPRGLLEVTVPLEAVMAEEVDRFQSAYNLTNEELEQTPATAGTVVMEGVGRVRQPTPPWPTRNVRGWALAAPLPRWPLLWSRSGAPSQTLEYHYQIDWQIPRLPYQFAFPVQVQAHFPERGNRQTLELLFVLTGWMPRLNPYFERAILRRGRGLPPFALQPARGRAMAGALEQEVVVEDALFDPNDHIARVLLRLAEEPPLGEEAWLTGEMVAGFVDTFSGMTIDACYDAFGHRLQAPQIEMLSRARLHFRIDLGALPYQSTTHHRCVTTLRGASARRDDFVVRELERQTRVVHVHERVLERALVEADTRFRVPIRDVMGHWPPAEGEEMGPVVFHLHMVPSAQHTRVQIQVELPETRTDPTHARAPAICAQLTSLLDRADRAFWDGSPGAASDEGPSPPDGGAPPLLRKLYRRDL